MFTFVQNGTVYLKTYINRMRNFQELLCLLWQNLDKIFTLRDCPYKFSEINVLSESKVKQKLEINMLDKLF